MVFLANNAVLVFDQINCVLALKYFDDYKSKINWNEIRKQILARTTNVNDSVFHPIFSKFEMVKISRIFCRK